MKKVLLIILIVSTVFAGEYELKLYEKVLPLVLKSKHIKVYVDKHSKNMLDGSNIFVVFSIVLVVIIKGTQYLII